MARIGRREVLSDFVSSVKHRGAKGKIPAARRNSLVRAIRYIACFRAVRLELLFRQNTTHQSQEGNRDLQAGKEIGLPMIGCKAMKLRFYFMRDNGQTIGSEAAARKTVCGEAVRARTSLPPLERWAQPGGSNGWMNSVEVSPRCAITFAKDRLKSDPPRALSAKVNVRLCGPLYEDDALRAQSAKRRARRARR